MIPSIFHHSPKGIGYVLPSFGNVNVLMQIVQVLLTAAGWLARCPIGGLSKATSLARRREVGVAHTGHTSPSINSGTIHDNPRSSEFIIMIVNSTTRWSIGVRSRLFAAKLLQRCHGGWRECNCHTWETCMRLYPWVPYRTDWEFRPSRSNRWNYLIAEQTPAQLSPRILSIWSFFFFQLLDLSYLYVLIYSLFLETDGDMEQMSLVT